MDYEFGGGKNIWSASGRNRMKDWNTRPADVFRVRAWLLELMSLRLTRLV